MRTASTLCFVLFVAASALEAAVVESYPVQKDYTFTTAEGDPFAGDWIRSTAQWVLWHAHSNPATSHIRFDQGVVGNRGFGQAWLLEEMATSDFVAEFGMMYDGGTGRLRFGWVDAINTSTGTWAAGANGWFVEINSNLNNIGHYSMTNGVLTVVDQTGAGWVRPTLGSRYNYRVQLVPGDGIDGPQLITSWGGPASLVSTSPLLANAPTMGYFGFWRFHETGGLSNFFVYDFSVGVIPEPAGLGLVVGGTLMLMRRRRMV